MEPSSLLVNLGITASLSGKQQETCLSLLKEIATVLATACKSPKTKSASLFPPPLVDSEKSVVEIDKIISNITLYKGIHYACLSLIRKCLII